MVTRHAGRERAFVWCVMVALLVPLAAMPLVSGSVSAEKADDTSAPALVLDDGSPNVSFLSDAGSWFESNFAFRGQLVDADARVEAGLLGTSPVENVVAGTDGWLYYAGTLNDYQRRLVLSDRELDNIAYNLALMQEAVEAQGGSFLFVCPPNKNSLYPQHMPYYLPVGEGLSNLERLEPLLVSYGVHHVDLLAAFQGHDGVLYLHRDSHWNNDGALLAYQLMEAALGRTPMDFAAGGATTEQHEGDVEAMLYPETAGTEDEAHYPASDAYQITNGASGVEDSVVQTSSTAEGATGSLLMYRDSFGNALLPYYATGYASATFTKLVPYDMTAATIAGAQSVVVERTERHLQFFTSSPPYLEAPSRDVTMAGTVEGTTTARASLAGSLLVVEGDLDPAMAEEGQGIYVRLTAPDGTSGTYEAFHVAPESANTADAAGEQAEQGFVQTEDGYRVYVADADLTSAGTLRVEVLVGQEGAATRVFDAECGIEGSQQ